MGSSLNLSSCNFNEKFSVNNLTKSESKLIKSSSFNRREYLSKIN